MTKKSLPRAACLGLLALATSACATTSNPWRAHDRTADVKALLADADRACPVVVHNGTGQVLEALVDLDGVDRSLGLLAEGQSTVVRVPCSARRVHAKGIAQTLGLSEGVRFAASALLDVTRETRLRFTAADKTRW